MSTKKGEREQEKKKRKKKTIVDRMLIIKQGFSSYEPFFKITNSQSEESNIMLTKSV
jgi:hypothetical protein